MLDGKGDLRLDFAIGGFFTPSSPCATSIPGQCVMMENRVEKANSQQLINQQQADSSTLFVS
jgi:hypothetical protein